MMAQMHSSATLMQSCIQLGISIHIVIVYHYRYLHSEADEARGEAGPESLLRDLVAAVDLEAVEALEELHEGLQASVRHVATS